MSILTAIRAGVREFRRTMALDGWQVSTVYTWPELLRPHEVASVLAETGLAMEDCGPLVEAGQASLWRLTLDKDADGIHHAGVMTCASDDSVREVVRLDRRAS